MRFTLRKAPKKNAYWVVDETGKHYSKDPLPKERAREQQKALYAAAGRGEMKGGVITKMEEMVDGSYYLVDGDTNQRIGPYATKQAALADYRKYITQTLTQRDGYREGIAADTETPVARPAVNKPVSDVRLQLAKKELLKQAIKEKLSEKPDFTDLVLNIPGPAAPSQPPTLQPKASKVAERARFAAPAYFPVSPSF